MKKKGKNIEVRNNNLFLHFAIGVLGIIAVIISVLAIGPTNIKNFLTGTKNVTAGADGGCPEGMTCDGGPTHSKVITANNDGTYTIKLSVTGEAEKHQNHVNVLVIMDTSGSMNSTRINGAKNAANSLAQALLSKNGAVDPETGETNDTDTVEMALITFNTSATTTRTPTTSYSQFQSSVNGLCGNGCSGGTNWEAAFKQVANVDFGDNDPTFVVFLTDGAPTFRVTQGEWNDWSSRYRQWGTGEETTTNMDRSYTHAVDDAQAVAASIGVANFYSIFAYGSNAGAQYLQNLTAEAGVPSSNYYNASDTTALNNAFTSILGSIEMAGFGNVGMTDGTTTSVTATSGDLSGSLLDVDTNSYRYKVTDANGNDVTSTITDLPEASLVGGAVKWDLSSLGVLKNGYTYTVEFDVWPSQTTLDLIADLKNDPSIYDDDTKVSPEVRKYLVRTGTAPNYEYKLLTNTQATLSYKDTRVENAQQQTVGFVNPPAVSTSSAEMLTVAKEWENDLDSRNQPPVSLDVNRDSETHYNVRLASNNPTPWSDTINISVGSLSVNKANHTVRILAGGHDYSFAEDQNITYHWELTADTVHPMIIYDGSSSAIPAVTELVKIADTDVPSGMGNYSYYAEGGKEYYKIEFDDDGNPNTAKKVGYYVVDNSNNGLVATNHRRSYLEIKKVVSHAEGTVPTDAKFKYTLTVTNSKADPAEPVTDDDEIWFSIYDTNKGETVTDDTILEVTGAQSNGSGYYYFPSGNTITFYMKDGYNLRVLNLPTESTYTITEATDATNMPSGYVFSKVTSVTGINVYNEETEESEFQVLTTEDKTTNTISGTIEESNRAYQEIYTNDYTKINFEVEKTWSDGNNVEGLRPDSIQVQLYKKVGTGEKQAVGEPVTITPDEDGYWKHKFEDLPRYEGQEEITYTVEEILGDLADLYTTEQSGDTTTGITIVNSRTPERTKISATKTWSDNEDQDGKRSSVGAKVQLYEYVGANQTKNPVGNPVDVEDVDGLIAEWEDLLVYKEGVVVKYSVEEILPEDSGYTSSGDGELISAVVTDTGVVAITNTHTPETISIPVEKIWNDTANRSNRISVTVQLKANGTAVAGKTTTLSAETWKSSFDNLPKYNAGTEIEYSIEETTSVPGYGTPTYNTTDDGTLQVINTLNTTTVSGQKQWNDGFDQSNRPKELSVNLLRDGQIIDTKVVTKDDNNWSYEWTNLPTHIEGSPVEYSVSEEVPVGYTSSVVGYNITNTLITVEVPVAKAWVGDEGLEANRPTSITVSLMANGNLVEGKTLTLSDDNDWSDKFANLPKFMDGNETPVVYTVVEGEVAGYTGSVSEATTTTVNGVETISYTITNTLDRTSITVHKDWQDANDQDGIRPGSITVSLNYGELTLTLDEDNDWTDTFENLPVYVNKTAYQYEVTEAQVTGYDEPVVGNLVEQEDGTYTVEITNTHTPEEITIQGSKVWDDANNQDGLRNDDTVIVVTLTSNDGEEPRVLRVSKGEDNDWAFSFPGLPKYKDGVEIVYTLTEAQVQGYEEPSVVLSSALSTDDVKVYTITNRHEPGKTSVTVHKVWDDADNQDGLRAPSIDVQLLANGNPVEGKTATLNAGNSWTYTFAELPEFAGTTTPIVYTFEETTSVAGYEDPTYSVNEDTGVLEVTNKHVPSETSVTVHKVWDDADNQDGLRPTSIEVQLLAGGTAVEGKTATLDESNGWTYTFDELPEFAGTTTPIVYTFEETASVAGYEDPEYSVNEETGVLEVTNKHTPEETEITATKIWDDSNNQDGKRPEAIQFQLYADETAVDGELVTLTANTTDKDGNWTYTWSNLPKYAGTTTPIAYTVEEVTDLTSAGYTAPTYSEDKLTVTNSRETEKVNISVNKVWADNNNQDGLQPGSVEVTLHSKTAAEESVTDEESVTLSSNNSWTNSWTNLPKYRDGKEITYSITETTTAVITGTDKEGEYAIKVEQNTTENNIAFTVTNTHTPITTEASVKKVWDDNNDQDGVRPTSLTIQLLADGQVVEGKTVTIDANNSEGTISGLPKYNKSTTPIVYSWRETNLTSDYELTDTSVSGTTTTLTNTHTPETTSITATKIWSDNNNQDGLRNADTKVTFELYADNVSTGKTITLSGNPAENRYSDSFTDLPVYKDHGTEIVYTVKEVVVPNGYEASAVGNKEAIGNKENSYTITNTHETETISISVLKKWSDNNNQDGLRNADTTVTFQLYANGTAVEGKTVTLTEANKWTDSFVDLDKKANGQDIVYTVKEVEVPNGYEPSAVGNDTATGTAENNYTITNTHTPEEIEVTVKKVWEDADDQDGLRSKANYSITLTGTREDGTTITIKNATVDLTPSVSSYTYKNLPKYDGGQLVTYTAEETTVPAGYEDSYSEDTLTITNTHTPATDAVVVTKVWDDEDNRDGIRPENITINLLADGTKVTGVTPKIVKDGNTWTFTFEGLPVYKDHGTEIVYTATEEEVEDYIGHPDGLTIRNEHPHETIDIPVTKQWVDANDQDGKRPTSIQIDLYADGTKYDSITLTKDANASSTNPNLWEGVFTDLPKYREGKEGEPIEYTIKEVSSVLDGETPLYTGTINDFDIINEHIPSKKSISVTKVWSDADDQDGMRETSVTVYLYKNGEKQEDTKQVLDASNKWTYTWENLPEYENGDIITYYVDEASVPEGYSKKVETEDQLNYTITNSHKPIEITISGTKTWEDADDQDGQRPESITVKVLKGEEVVDTITVSADEAGNWTYESKKLPKFEGGQEIKYTVVEEKVPGYETVIPEGEYNITNKHTPETVEYVITKSWDDAEDNDAIRPESITVKLLADGEVIKTVKVSGPEWTYTFGPLDKNKGGKAIKYTIEEEEVPGYVLVRSEPVVTNKTITEVLTNKHTPEPYSINGKKTWVDENNKDGKRPEYITVYVYADGVKIAELKVDANSNWEYELNDLLKYNHSTTPIVYTIEELPVEGYETEYNGFDITNILTDVEGEKEEFPPDTYAKDQATYRIDFLVMLLAGYILTSYRRVIKE